MACARRARSTRMAVRPRRRRRVECGMISELDKLLDFLCEMAGRSKRDAEERRFLGALGWRPVDRPPLVIAYPYPESARFPLLPHREVFEDPEKMLYNELLCAFDTSIALHGEIGDDLPFTVRANYGTVLIASIFGVNVEQIADNPPWIRHAHGQALSLETIAAADPRDCRRGWIPRAAETMQRYREILNGYPELDGAVHVVLPDLQGPFDNLELIRGSDVFIDLISDPERVDAALAALARTQVDAARYLGQWTSEPHDGYCHQHAVMLKGNILLRNDSCVMVSPEMYRDQIAPHDESVLREMGGGGIHSCGNIGHLVDEFLALPSLRSLDLGQPELNDVGAVYRKAAAREMPLIRVTVDADEIRSGVYRERFPTGAVLIHRAACFEEAQKVGNCI